MKKHYSIDQITCFLMYIDYNKIHGSHSVHNQVQSLHDFVQGIVGTLSPANHDGALTNGTRGNLMLEPVNDECDTLIHDFVQIGRDTRHLRHHTNLKPEKNVCQCPGHEKKKNGS